LLKGTGMITWSDITQNWAWWFSRMKTRFPDLEDSSMPFLKQDRDRFEAYLAHTHDLTVSEAREEFQAFLTRETEGRDAVSLRALG